MFTDWKRAATLARFELSVGAAYFILIFIASGLIAIFLGTTFHNYVKEVTTVFDFVFIGLFSILPSFFKPSDTQYQKVNGDLWASHIFIMQKQLPINERILIKSRFIIHFAYTLPMLTLILTFTYPFISDVMSIGVYVVFALIWLSFSVYCGLIMGVSDAGDYVNFKTIIISILKIAVFLTLLVFIFHRILQIGIVEFTILLSKQQPFLAIIVSLLLAIFSIKYWERFMKKTIRKMDYL